MKRLNYKESKKLMYRQQIDYYISLAEMAYNKGEVWTAKQYIKIASKLSNYLVRLDASGMSNRQLKKKDMQLVQKFEAMYPDAVELPV